MKKKCKKCNGRGFLTEFEYFVESYADGLSVRKAILSNPCYRQ